MAKHPRKKQKTSKDAEVQPLGSAQLDALHDDASKDDEERELESILFGTKYEPRGDSKRKGDTFAAVADEEDLQDVQIETGAGQEMQHLLDTDLFYVDDAAPSMPIITEMDIEEEISSPASDAEDDDDEDDERRESESESEEDDEHEPSEPKPESTTFAALTSRKSKVPAWTDPSDRETNASVSLLSGPSRLRKLREAQAEDTISGKEYETRLRRQFERLNPEPEWARKARKAKAEKRAAEGEDDNEMDDLLASTSGILSRKTAKDRKSPILSTGTIAIERLRDANQAAQGSGSGEVRVVAFHPSDKVPVLCVATADRRIRLFNVDGHTSPLLSTLHVPSLPITSPTSAVFHPLGNSILLTGPRPYFFTHDLQSGATVKHSRGLWGTTFSSINESVNGSRKRSRSAKNGGDSGEGISLTAFSPYTGDMLAVAGRGGYVHLVDWKSGAGQVVGSLKCGATGGGIQGMWWVPPNAGDSVLGGSSAAGVGVGAAGAQLAVLSGDAEVYLWDVGQRRCVKRWKDEGGFRGAGKVMAGTTSGLNGGLLAIGSNTGFVNVYASDSFAAPLSESETFGSMERSPKPIKSIGNLTTSISSLCFNHDAQLMAIASKEKKDALRLAMTSSRLTGIHYAPCVAIFIHLPSLTSFANWPTSTTPLGHVTAVDFSARSEYVAIGNSRGKVLLYHLRDYGSPSGTYH
ncbi:WD40-repeat-containing domain protein [Cyathus striatus]|nr:WD40-repeat-containing domain protein [Cyathus striatus]